MYSYNCITILLKMIWADNKKKKIKVFKKCKNNNCNQEGELEEEEKSKHLTCLSGVISFFVEIRVTDL